ncbi:hypothetical protein [uncultured Helicobacter sp.]|uniref:hypothetical protein n=1 Tax=uncultured Helicobacter sp. TaxID=175537 RepID=UPI0026F3E6F7|nr:hypothetical protein [uncultured Helicobacter sp.]
MGNIFKMMYRICLMLLFAYAALYAARPMITDDARVVDRHSCQLETWGIYDGKIGEYYVIPGCNLFLDIEISMGAMMSNLPANQAKESVRAQQFIFSAKRVFSDLETQGYSYGIALGNAYNFLYSKYSNDYYLYIPASMVFFDNKLLLHSNLGYKLQRRNDEPHIFYAGLGLEQQITQRLWLLGEALYERFEKTKFQVGVRIWLLQDKIQLDSTYGNAFSGGGSWVSVGLRFLSPEFF